VFAGTPRPNEAIAVSRALDDSMLVNARNVNLFGGPLYMCWQRGITSWLDDWSPDVLIVGADPRMISNRSAVRWARRHRVPILGWGLGVMKGITGPTARVRTIMRNRLFRSFDGAIAYGSKAARDYRAAGLPADRVFVAPNAVSTLSADTQPLQRGDDCVARWRCEMGFTRPTLITVGRLIPEKRIDLLLGVCRSIGDGCDLVIAGDGPERDRLESLAGEIFPRARFLGHVEGDALSLAFAASDIFVLPGAGGLAIHEAMGHGKPVVVAEADGTEEDLVESGVNGVIVPPGDSDALQAAICDYLDNPEKAHLAGAESHRLATGKLSIEGMADAFIDAIRSVQD
jgi:glycosyltransferase involved in cell wall biosynthesis